MNEVKSVRECILEYRKYKKDKYLINLIISLKNNEVYIAVDKDTQISVSEDDESPNFKSECNIYPVIVASNGNKFWYSCFSDIDEIPNSFVEKYLIIPVFFKDIVDECLKAEGIEGISINHKSQYADLPKFLLREIRQYL